MAGGVDIIGVNDGIDELFWGKNRRNWKITWVWKRMY
jgi:hypothetical protein